MELLSTKGFSCWESMAPEKHKITSFSIRYDYNETLNHTDDIWYWGLLLCNTDMTATTSQDYNNMITRPQTGHGVFTLQRPGIV